MLDKLSINLDKLIIEKWEMRNFYLPIQNICTQQNHCFASVCAECIIIYWHDKNFFANIFNQSFFYLKSI